MRYSILHRTSVLYTVYYHVWYHSVFVKEGKDWDTPLSSLAYECHKQPQDIYLSNFFMGEQYEDLWVSFRNPGRVQRRMTTALCSMWCPWERIWKNRPKWIGTTQCCISAEEAENVIWLEHKRSRVPTWRISANPSSYVYEQIACAVLERCHAKRYIYHA